MGKILKSIYSQVGKIEISLLGFLNSLEFDLNTYDEAFLSEFDLRLLALLIRQAKTNERKKNSMAPQYWYSRQG